MLILKSWSLGGTAFARWQARLVGPCKTMSRALAVVAVPSENPAANLKRSKRTKIAELHRKVLTDFQKSGNNKGINNESSDYKGSIITVKGWVKTVRSQKNFSFLEVSDGSSIKGLQIVADLSMPGYAEVIPCLSTGAAVEISGRLMLSPGRTQAVELHADTVQLVGECPAEYPLQKKRHTLEFLRTISHIRSRSNLISSVARIRSKLAYSTHNFFQNEGFLYLHTPLITSSDCEGAGEMFRVTTLPIDKPGEIPTISTDEGAAVNKDYKQHEKTDFSKDFFAKPSYLTVSGQLSAETYACSMGDVYTFGPTFRAELSQTTRHLAEFHMIEPEMAFADLHDAMDNAEKMVKFVANETLSKCQDDYNFLDSFVEKGIQTRIGSLVSNPFARISYRKAVDILQKEISKDPKKWQYPVIEFGTDLQTEHERFLAEVYFKGCVFVHNYPRKIKSFYMRDSDIDPETVDSFDLLVPGVGELIGGSQREERLKQLEAKLDEFGLRREDYWWYLDLRRYGSCPHSGYGLGFERLVAYLTGVSNIREAIAYPRYHGWAEF
jgi:asparaginyl-tRNA synthetase